jgi:hypothetical protein
MAGFVPAIRVLLAKLDLKDVDARHKAGHDEIIKQKAPAKPGPS